MALLLAIRIAVIQSAAIHVVALIVVPTLVLSAVLILAAIPAEIPVRDARSADFHEELREEFHAAFLSPAQVVRCVARVRWQERSRSFPVVARVFPLHPRGRGLVVAEAQAVLQHRLVEVEFPGLSQGLLLVLLRLVDSLRAPAVRVRERLSSSLDCRLVEFRERVQQHLFVAPEFQHLAAYQTFHVAADRRHHARGRDRQPGVRSVLQPAGLFAPDCQNLDAARASRHADCRNHAGLPDPGVDNDRHGGSDGNADLFDSTTTDTSRCRCRMRS